MQTATSETDSKSCDISICVHHYTLRAPCPKGRGKFTREYPNLVDRNHISTHTFSGQKMGGEALVPHSQHDLGSRSSPPHLFQLSHWLALLSPPFEMPVSWHPAF